MIQLTHLTGSRAGQVDQSPNAVVRLGRGTDCDVRFDATVDRTVSTHHAEIRFDGQGYLLVDLHSSNGTLINGRPAQQQRLSPGDIIAVGGEVGPQLRFDVPQVAVPSPRARATHPSAAKAAPAPVTDDDVLNAAQAAVAKARQSRQASGGAAPTGQTMFLMVDAINQVVEKKKSNFKRNLAIVIGVAVVIFAVMGYVILHQRALLNAKVDQKKSLDTQIAQLQQQIQLEPDAQKRKAEVAQLDELTGKAEQVTQELESTSKGQQAMARAGLGHQDFVDQQIQEILHEFEADTYSIPQNFRDAVKADLQKWQHDPSLPRIWARRQRYWPMISQAFAQEQVPDVMAYVAWQESEFNPEICSQVGARGMWQFMPSTARRYGLRVSHVWDHCQPKGGAAVCNCGSGTDERTDPYKSSRAAAQYLGDLLAQFGMSSFMLAIASYNKGEHGMRQVLCQYKLRTRAQRDFWNLYYMRYLPQETLDYVPRIIAASIIGHNPQRFGLTP